MTLDQLKAFHAVWVCGSFRDAARRLNQTQPNISYLIGKLESEIGGSLFVRNKSTGTTISELGIKIMPVVRKMLDGESKLLTMGTSDD